MAVKIRMKKMGRRHRPFFRVCVMDARCPRDGRVLEEVGIYDPMVSETDARTTLNGERIAYWLGVGAQPTDKVAILIKKYGQSGTHLEEREAALKRLAVSRRRPDVPTDLPKQQQTKQQPKQKKGKLEKVEAPEAVAETPADVAPTTEVAAETVA
ncbi:MAG: 30S ribosomal protein S16 [Thermoguttaceae bacterium]